jgi:hypothetical protein
MELLEERSLLSTSRIGTITYLDEVGAQRIYAFARSRSDHLVVNYWDGNAWHWADQGTPPGVSLGGDPSAITYRDATNHQRIYVFNRGSDGQLYVNYWDGFQWRWADQGTPPGVSIRVTPGTITYQDGGGHQRIYAFMWATDGNMYVNYWDGSAWHWANQGTPPTTNVAGSPGVITYQDGAGVRRIYAFVRGNDRHLYVNYWDGAAWHWADQGAPPSTGVAFQSDPGVVTYRQGTNPQRIYAFVNGDSGHLFVNYWDGSRWNWADQGSPQSSFVIDTASVLTYQDGGVQRIYAFDSGQNGHLFVNYWDGGSWHWADQGTPPGTVMAGDPGAITYRDAFGHQRIYAFTWGSDGMGFPGHLFVDYWDGFQWRWADQGAPPGSSMSPAGTHPAADGKPGALLLVDMALAHGDTQADPARRQAADSHCSAPSRRLMLQPLGLLSAAELDVLAANLLDPLQA